MTDNDWTVQVSPKLPDGSLINVRGMSVDAVVADLLSLAEKSAQLTDAMRLIAAAGTAVNAGHAAAQAAPAAPAPAAWTPPATAATAAPAASQPGAAPSCQHGPREYKTGEKNGKTWKAWFCTAPKGQSCPAQWVS